MINICFEYINQATLAANTMSQEAGILLPFQLKRKRANKCRSLSLLGHSLSLIVATFGTWHKCRWTFRGSCSKSPFAFVLVLIFFFCWHGIQIPIPLDSNYVRTAQVRAKCLILMKVNLTIYSFVPNTQQQFVD